MELRPGYKQTDVGVIPTDWDVTSLAALSTKITDGDHATPKRESEGYYLLSARNILNGRIDLSDVDYVGEVEFRRMRQRCNPELGDVLISCSGTIGRITVVADDIECVLVRSAALVKIDAKYADGRFLQYWLQSEKAQKQISESVNQGAQPNLFLNHIEKISCAKPPRREQATITTALGDVDMLLTLQDALIAKKRAIKQGAMQVLLTGKRRLPGFCGEWEVRRLGEIATMGSGGTPNSAVESYYGGDVPWVSIADMTMSGKVLEITQEHLTSLGMENSAAKMFPAGTVLYAMYASLGECSIAGIPVATSQAILGIQTKPLLSNEFLYYYLTAIKSVVKTLGQQGTQANLNKGLVQEFEMSLPPFEEQAAIADVLCDMDAEITALESQRAKTALLKLGMMQELLTGRIRLV